MAEHAYYLTTHPDPHGRGLMAVVTLGHPQLGDATAKVCTVDVVADQQAANVWFDRMMVEKPWEERN